MENEIRYYLGQIKDAMTNPKDPSVGPFVPQYIITAVKLETGAIEIAMNTSGIPEKIDYILEAYDENMCHKRNPNVIMQNIMVV